jgi:hypothetical protein
MNENKFNLGLNLPQRHRKGVMTTFGVIVAPFYRVSEVMAEGTPVVLDDAKPGFVKKATAGACENGVFGIVAQEVYDPSVLGELAGYEFHNNTKARVGDTVGVIIGQGYVETINYAGTIAAGEKLYVGSDGKLVNTKSGNDLPVGVAENGGVNGGDYIRVRVNFDFFADTVEATEDGSNSN